MATLYAKNKTTGEFEKVGPVASTVVNRTEPDLLIKINSDIYDAKENFLELISIVSGSIDSVLDIYENGGTPTVEVEIDYNLANNYTYTRQRIAAQFFVYGDYFDVTFISNVNYYPLRCFIEFSLYNHPYTISRFNVYKLTGTEL